MSDAPEQANEQQTDQQTNNLPDGTEGPSKGHQDGGDDFGQPSHEFAGELAYVDAPTPEQVENAWANMAEASPEQAAKLKAEWGNDGAQNLHFAQVAAQAFATPELVAALEETGMGNDPALVAAAAAVGRRLAGEPGNPNTLQKGDIRVAETPSERAAVQKRIDDIHALQSGDHQAQQRYRSDAVQKELNGLYSKLYGTGPIVGREGRRL